MSQIPASVVWFAITATIAIIFGLNRGHVNAIGFDAYVNELKKKFDIETNEAISKAKFSFWFDWSVIITTGSISAACVVITLINLVNPK